MNRSRLSRRLAKKTLRSIIGSIIGIIIIFVVLIKFGIPLLVNFSLLVSGTKDTKEVISKNKTTFIPSPVLDALPNATNSATIKISGTAMPKQIINLYVNGTLEDKTDVKDDKTFVFNDILLTKGENLIQTKAAIHKDATIGSEEAESNFSSSVTVVYKKDSPSLTLTAPSDNQSFSKDDKQVLVKGKTDTGVKITVNNFWAIVDGDGNFSYTLPLQNGDNKIKISATDEAGNKKEVEIKVTYSQ